MEDIINIKAKEYFNIEYVFPYQRLVISNILRASGYYTHEEKLESNPNQIVLLPTGSGKSLCFMLPAIFLEGITLIIFPLISLMTDQERRIKESGLKSVVLKGGLSPKEKNSIFELIINNEVNFILTNPEMLGNKDILKILARSKISHIVIDEAHTVSQWGESFRPAYLELGNFISTINCNLITAFTATASEYILKCIKKTLFNNKSINIIKDNPDRKNIHYTVISTISKNESLIDLIKMVEKPAIVFHNSRVSCEVTSRLLRNRTSCENILYYHAGLSKEDKINIEEFFYNSDNAVLNATCAYGMGVDKKNIRTVIHIDTPTSIEAFLQESGRGGRDRKPAKSYLLITKTADNNIIEKELLNNKCRRETLLKLMGSENDNCNGCDVCDNTIKLEEDGLLQIKQFLKHNPYIYTLNESSKILKGFYHKEIFNFKYDAVKGFGLLRKWDLDSIKDSLELLIKKNLIIESKNILTWNKLSFNKNHY